MKAADVINMQLAYLYAESRNDDQLRKYLADQGDGFQTSFELQFLWGFFLEHTREYDLPTDQIDRVKLHLVDWLIRFRDQKLMDAVAEANAVEDLFDRADPLFDAIAKAGAKAYNQPQGHTLTALVKIVSNKAG